MAGSLNVKNGMLTLPSKPTAKLTYTFLPGSPTTNTLIVFLNGLILPQTSWLETIHSTNLKTQDLGIPRPHLLSYDRCGQGTSDKDPTGEHDALDSAHDLHSFLHQLRKQENLTKELNLIFTCNSIGCAVARLYASIHPCTIAGFIFLDSIMANVDLVSVWPDPDAADFDAGTLPAGVTVEMLRHVREEYRKKFHASVPNPEGLSRESLSGLLPRADMPKLNGPEEGKGPWVTVVGHDWDRFAEENEKSFGVPKALVMRYLNPVWHEYNNELATLTDREKSKGPIIAPGCSHFIQKDDPDFVASEICKMLQRLDGISSRP